MAVVTLLTDSGNSDYYVAAIKARILSVNSAINIVDISHHVDQYDIAHGAFLLRSVFHDFPNGTVHLVGVNTADTQKRRFVALELDKHFFVGANNGLLSLISSSAPQHIIDLNSINTITSTFPEKDILAPAATKLASGMGITSLGKPLSNGTFKKMTDRLVKVTPKEIVGRVIRIDCYGNLITNIVKCDFDRVGSKKKFVIRLAGELFKHIHTNYNQVEAGECFLLFNAQSLLEIGVNKGRADELLGLAYDSPIHINFED